MPVDPADLIRDAEANPAPGHNALAVLEGLVQLHQEQIEQYAENEDELKTLKAAITLLEQQILPDMMLQVGLETFTTVGKVTVTVKPIVTGSISKGNKEPAHDWLRKHGHGDIIKQDVTVSFTKEQSEAANLLFQELVVMGHAPVRSESVHASTLKSWAADQIQQGVSLPMTLLGLFHGRIAKFKLPKT